MPAALVRVSCHTDARGGHAGAAVVVGIARSRWYRTDVPPPAAFQEQSSSRQLRTCIPHAQHNEHAACWLRSPHRSAGRGRSELESRVSPSVPSECARFDGCCGVHDRLIHVRDWRQLEAGWTRLVRVVRLAPMSSWCCEVECERQERPAQPHRSECVVNTQQPGNTTGTARRNMCDGSVAPGASRPAAATAPAPDDVVAAAQHAGRRQLTLLELPRQLALSSMQTPPRHPNEFMRRVFFFESYPGAIVMTKSGRVVKPPVASDATAATIQSAVPATAVRKRPRRSPGPTRKGAVVERLVRRLHSLAEAKAKYGKKFVTPYESAETGVRKNWEVLEARRGDVLVLREADAQQKVGSLILGRAWRRLRVTWPTA